MEYFLLAMVPYLTVGVALIAGIDVLRTAGMVVVAAISIAAIVVSCVTLKRTMPKMDQMLPDPEKLPIAERIEDQATRAARSVREELGWSDADKALVRARELLKVWQRTQPHPHSG